MATILYVGTYGTVDPTRATLPFISAVGALQAGHQPQIVLLAESTILVKDHIIEQIKGVGFAPLPDLWANVIENDVPVFV